MNSKMAICLLCAVTVAIPKLSRADQEPPATNETAAASSAPSDYKQLYEQQKKRNDELDSPTFHDHRSDIDPPDESDRAARRHIQP